jgi:hypothetical protein
MKSYLLIMPLILISLASLASIKECEKDLDGVDPTHEIFSSEIINEKTLNLDSIGRDLESELALCKPTCPPPVLSRKISKVLLKGFTAAGVAAQRTRGYAIIISAMVVDAAVITHLTKVLPENYKIISQFLTIASVWGFYDIGAPIVRPISSRVTKIASRIAYGSEPVSKTTSLLNSDWNEVYYRNQKLYDMTAVMGRNIVNQFLSIAHQNFSDAHRAMEKDDPEYAAAQIAGAAIRQHLYEEDIKPDDESVALDVRVTFSYHIKEKEELASLVREKISLYDPDSNKPEVKVYYEALLRAWLIGS